MSGKDPDFQITEEAKNHIRKAFETWIEKLRGERLRQAKKLHELPSVGESFGACIDGHHLKTTAQSSGAKAVKYVEDLRDTVIAFRDATEEVWKAYERTDEGAGAAIESALAKYDAMQKLMPRDFAPVLPGQGHIVGFA